MANASGRCVICGASPTVKVHLFPRALVKRIRGDEKNLVEGSRNEAGIKITQSGHWDEDFLCGAHEHAFATSDDYAARFYRRFERGAVLSSTGKSYELGNPRPDLLLRFVYATVWRYVASNQGQKNNLQLGPYRDHFERVLFEGEEPFLEALISRSNIVDRRGKSVSLGIPPYRRKLMGRTVWHSSLAGFDFYLKTDQRSYPLDLKEFLINDNDPITIPVIDPLRFDSIPMLQPIFMQMLKAG